MKVKIFYTRNNHERLELEMNNWFDKNKDINVVMIRSTQSGRMDCHYTVIVQYT